jgi:UPF0755 protein
MKRLALGLLVLVLLGAGAGGGLWFDYQRVLDTPLTVEERIQIVERGASIDSIARDLEREGLLERALYLRIHGRLSGLANRIKAGEYRLNGTTTPRSLLDDMVAGRVVQHALTVVDGWTFRQLLEALWEHDRIHPTLRDLDDDVIMKRLDSSGESPEGWFFPDTYHFPTGTTDLAFLRRAHRAMERELAAAWEIRQDDLPLDSPYQALILASIIEKETGLAGERPEVAGVFIRRLRRGMLLQTDPTVIYGLGEDFEGELLRTHLNQDHPYNTYTRPGLPPTPIALPGRASLRAAVDPAPGDTLYFVADGNGGHVFSRTLDEHNRAVRAYRRARQ